MAPCNLSLCIYVKIRFIYDERMLNILRFDGASLGMVKASTPHSKSLDKNVERMDTASKCSEIGMTAPFPTLYFPDDMIGRTPHPSFMDHWFLSNCQRSQVNKPKLLNQCLKIPDHLYAKCLSPAVWS